MATEPFDAVLAEMRLWAADTGLAIFNQQADRLSAAHAAEAGERDADIFHLRDDLTDAIGRADRAMGLLRELRATGVGLNDHWRERIDAFLAEQAQVGGENGNG